MKYRVRTKDGELTYESRVELQEAARAGLVEGDDEIQNEGETTWRPASEITWLTTARAKRSWLSSPFVRWILLALLGSIAAFVLIYKGRVTGSYELQAAGIGIVVVVAVILMRVTTAAQRRR